jgi:methionyl-tRNA formyltransferase
MKCVLAGSRYFGATVLDALRREPGVEFVAVIAPAADDRLALAAEKAGLPVHVLANPKIVPGEAIPEGTDLIVAAHTHARVSNEALARSKLGGIGYHPSLLPRHRGIAAVEWTILEGDPIAGFRLTSEDYLQVGRDVASMKLPVVFTLEGGYAVEAMGVNVVNVLEGFYASPAR